MRRRSSVAWAGTALLAVMLWAVDTRGQAPGVEGLPAWPRVVRDLKLPVNVAPAEPAELHVFEDGDDQPGVSLKKDDAPASVCLVIDVSNSMKENAAAVLAMARRVVFALRPEDEIEIVSFRGPVHLEQDFTTDRAKIETAFGGLTFAGGSGLLDAVATAIGPAQSAPRYRPVLVVISDGDDNYSHIQLPVLLHRLMSPPAAIVYTLTPSAPHPTGARNLDPMARATGGLVFVADEPAQLLANATEVAHDIHGRYRLEYTSTHTQADGKLHRIEVKVQPLSGSRAKTLFRQEYYAPSQ